MLTIHLHLVPTSKIREAYFIQVLKTYMMKKNSLKANKN